MKKHIENIIQVNMKEQNNCKICGREKSKYATCSCSRGYIDESILYEPAEQIGIFKDEVYIMPNTTSSLRI